MAKVRQRTVHSSRHLQAGTLWLKPDALRVAPYVLIYLAFVLRALNITGESLWRDEVDTVRFAFASISEMLGNLTRNGFNGPLYHLLMRGWLTLGGVNDFTLRYFSLLCGVAEVALIYILTRRLFGRRAALLAAWFATIAPVLIWYSGEGKMYTLQPALIVLAVYALRRAVDQRMEIRDLTLRMGGTSQSPISKLQSPNLNPWWLVFVVAVSLGYYVHLLTPVFLAVAVVLYLVWWPRSKHHWRGALMALALCTLPYVPMAVWQVPTFIAGNHTGHAFYSLEVMLFSLLFNWSLGLSDQLPPGAPAALPWLGTLVFAGTAIAGLVCAAIAADTHPQAPGRKANRVGSSAHSAMPIGGGQPFGSAVGMLAWLLLPMTLIYFISTRAPVFEPRYLLWSAPALYILVSLGLAWLMPRLWLVTGLLVTLLTVVSLWGVVAQMVYPVRPDIRAAAQLVATEMRPDDLLMFQIPYTRYGFEYYLPRFAPQLPVDPSPLPDDGLRTIQGLRDRIVDAPYTNEGTAAEAVDAQLQPLLARSPRIWLIEAETPLWDRQNLVRAWYDAHMQLVRREELHGIAVNFYEIAGKTRLFLPLTNGQKVESGE